MNKARWVWMPHAGHLIVSRDCQFFLNTYIGKYIISTVGEYVPDAPVREIMAESRGIKLCGKGDARLFDYMKKIGFEELGLNRTYKTLVFKAKKSNHKCCPYTAKSWREVENDGYNSAEDAFKGHNKMCRKWAKR